MIRYSTRTRKEKMRTICAEITETTYFFMKNFENMLSLNDCRQSRAARVAPTTTPAASAPAGAGAGGADDVAELTVRSLTT